MVATSAHTQASRVATWRMARESATVRNGRTAARARARLRRCAAGRGWPAPLGRSPANGQASTLPPAPAPPSAGCPVRRQARSVGDGFSGRDPKRARPPMGLAGFSNRSAGLRIAVALLPPDLGPCRGPDPEVPGTGQRHASRGGGPLAACARWTGSGRVGWSQYGRSRPEGVWRSMGSPGRRPRDRLAIRSCWRRGGRCSRLGLRICCIACLHVESQSGSVRRATSTFKPGRGSWRAGRVGPPGR